ncbi:SDR family oxidoreductase [Chloroflexota bacterium]
MTGKKVVVTGGAGFIGSNLAEELAKRGYYVVILDDLCTGKRKNIELLIKQENVEFIQGSITNLSLLQQVFKGVQYVFHQAAIPSVPRSIENPQATHEVNITGTLNVLLAARDSNVRKVVCASSSSVYGDTPTLPKREDMVPNPQSPYAVTKLTGECYCHVFQKVYALNTICLRYFNVYGPRQDLNSQYAAVIPNFISMVTGGNPPIIFGNGEQIRDFTFIQDVIEANILAAESECSGVFNIGRGENISLNSLTNLIINLTGSNMVAVHKEPRTGDVKDSLADISRAKAFGYEPKWSFEEGLKETIGSFPV